MNTQIGFEIALESINDLSWFGAIKQNNKKTRHEVVTNYTIISKDKWIKPITYGADFQSGSWRKTAFLTKYKKS